MPSLFLVILRAGCAKSYDPADDGVATQFTGKAGGIREDQCAAGTNSRVGGVAAAREAVIDTGSGHQNWLDAPETVMRSISDFFRGQK